MNRSTKTDRKQLDHAARYHARAERIDFRLNPERDKERLSRWHELVAKHGSQPAAWRALIDAQK